MVPFTRRREQKHVYNIYGIEYNNKSEAAAAHNCSEQTIHNRCVVNKSKKWSDWKREKLNND